MWKEKTLLISVIALAVLIIGMLALGTSPDEIRLSPSAEKIASYSPTIGIILLVVVLVLFLVVIYHNTISKEIKKSKLDKKFGKAVDKFVYLAGFIAVLISLPQILKIWVDGDASGVSAITWGAYFVISSVWFVYASIHKYRPIALAYFFIALANFVIFLGVIIYG